MSVSNVPVKVKVLDQVASPEMSVPPVEIPLGNNQREITAPMENPLPSLENITIARDAYIKFIRTCYELHPRAFRYYEELVDYISAPIDSAKITSRLPKVFQVLNSTDRQYTPGISDPRRLFAFVPCGLQEVVSCPRIALIEGLPSPEAISCLGATLSVPPELFLGHLELGRQQTQPQTFYELPTIPSKRQHIIRVRTISIGKNPVGSHVGQSMEQKRIATSKNSTQCERDTLKELRYGSTRIRRINLHTKSIFTFEQMISIHISSDSKSPDLWRGNQAS